MRRRSILLAAAAALLAFASCAGGKGAGRPPAPLPAAAPPPAEAGPRVAVAPMENRSNDLDASEIVRAAFAEGLRRRGWSVAPVAESDNVLRESLGINYGGQLKTTTPEEVCRALDVDGVFYGDVLEWNKTTAGIYNDAVVEAEFRLYGKDGLLRWGGGDRLVRRDVPRGGGGGSSLLAEIVVRALGNLVLNPMTPYGAEVGRRIAGKVPPGALSFPPREEPAEKEVGR